MNNPFEHLGAPKIEDETIEEVGGTFFCQTQACYNVSTAAKYLTDRKVLTWICQSNHISKVEGFEIYG